MRVLHWLRCWAEEPGYATGNPPEDYSQIRRGCSCPWMIAVDWCFRTMPYTGKRVKTVLTPRWFCTHSQMEKTHLIPGREYVWSLGGRRRPGGSITMITQSGRVAAGSRMSNDQLHPFKFTPSDRHWYLLANSRPVSRVDGRRAFPKFQSFSDFILALFKTNKASLWMVTLYRRKILSLPPSLFKCLFTTFVNSFFFVKIKFHIYMYICSLFLIKAENPISRILLNKTSGFSQIWCHRWSSNYYIVGKKCFH